MATSRFRRKLEREISAREKMLGRKLTFEEIIAVGFALMLRGG